jgi:hypothetical protein
MLSNVNNSSHDFARLFSNNSHKGETMKKVIFTLFVIIAISALLHPISYYIGFTISDNTDQLQESITSFIDRPSKTGINVDIKQSVKIDNKKYALFIRNDSMGLAVLTKGFNHKYKIYSAEYGGSGFFRGYIYKTNKAKYLVVYGSNKNLKINYVKVSLEGKEYKINVPKQEYYIVYCKVPDETKNKFPDIYSYKFYDANDVEIIIY